jgi:hypothetical protein
MLLQGDGKMSKFKSRLASRTTAARGGRSMFDANELSWIMLAVGGLAFFAYLTG